MQSSIRYIDVLKVACIEKQINVTHSAGCAMQMLGERRSGAVKWKLGRRGKEGWGEAGRRRGGHGKSNNRARRGDAVRNGADQGEKEVGAGRKGVGGSTGG